MSARRIVSHEWRMLSSDATLWIVAVVFLLAIGYGTFNGVRWNRFQTSAIAAAEREERTRFETHDAAIARLNQRARERACHSPTHAIPLRRAPGLAHGMRCCRHFRSHRWRSGRATCCRITSR